MFLLRSLVPLSPVKMAAMLITAGLHGSRGGREGRARSISKDISFPPLTFFPPRLLLVSVDYCDPECCSFSFSSSFHPGFQNLEINEVSYPVSLDFWRKRRGWFPPLPPLKFCVVNLIASSSRFFSLFFFFFFFSEE